MTIEENKNIVLNWLKINQIHYDNIIFSPEDKLEIFAIMQIIMNNVMEKIFIDVIVGMIFIAQ